MGKPESAYKKKDTPKSPVGKIAVGMFFLLTSIIYAMPLPDSNLPDTTYRPSDLRRPDPPPTRTNEASPYTMGVHPQLAGVFRRDVEIVSWRSSQALGRSASSARSKTGGLPGAHSGLRCIARRILGDWWQRAPNRDAFTIMDAGRSPCITIHHHRYAIRPWRSRRPRYKLSVAHP